MGRKHERPSAQTLFLKRTGRAPPAPRSPEARAIERRSSHNTIQDFCTLISSAASCILLIPVYRVREGSTSAVDQIARGALLGRKPGPVFHV